MQGFTFAIFSFFVPQWNHGGQALHGSMVAHICIIHVCMFYIVYILVVCYLVTYKQKLQRA